MSIALHTQYYHYGLAIRIGVFQYIEEPTLALWYPRGSGNRIFVTSLYRLIFDKFGVTPPAMELVKRLYDIRLQRKMEAFYESYKTEQERLDGYIHSVQGKEDHVQSRKRAIDNGTWVT